MTTIRYHCEKYGVKKDAARMRYNTQFGGGFLYEKQISDEDAAVLFSKEMSSEIPAASSAPTIREKLVRKTGAKKERKDAEHTHAKTAKTRENIAAKVSRKDVFCALLFAVEISHGGMLISEGFSLYGLPGLFATIAIFATVLAALVISGDPAKNRTSEYAVWACLFLYAASGRVHYEAFVQARPNALHINLGAAVIVPLAAFIALYLYRDVNNE